MPAPEETAQVGISFAIARSLQAFRRDLPQLLQETKLYRQWVAYYQDDRIGIARSELDLYRECYRRGLKRGEFIVRCIIPEMPSDLDVTPTSDV